MKGGVENASTKVGDPEWQNAEEGRPIPNSLAHEAKMPTLVYTTERNHIHE